MDKLIVVTGGTRGIGRAIVEKFISQGFDVVTCSRKAPALTQLKKALNKNFPDATVHVKQADLSDKDDAKDFCTFIRELKRPVNVLVNNAGYFLPGDIATEPEGTLEAMINANLFSAYHVTRGVVGLMRNRQKNHIFNLCSIASFMAYPNGGSYAISKFALLGFSKCLRAELKADGIRVTAVMPGATLTDSWEGTTTPEERFMTATDVADSIFAAYSLSERSVVEEIIIRPQLGDL